MLLIPVLPSAGHHPPLCPACPSPQLQCHRSRVCASLCCPVLSPATARLTAALIQYNASTRLKSCKGKGLCWDWWVSLCCNLTSSGITKCTRKYKEGDPKPSEILVISCCQMFSDRIISFHIEIVPFSFTAFQPSTSFI